MSRARPNVVLLMIDDLRADMASAPTPHIDRLAAHSVEFTEAHAQVSCRTSAVSERALSSSLGHMTCSRPTARRHERQC